MALFGGSKSSTSNTSTQQGIEGGGNIASGGSTINNIDEFPAAVADFADSIIGLASQSVSQSGSALSSLATVAEREKTPLTEWLPIIAVGAVALVLLSRNF